MNPASALDAVPEDGSVLMQAVALQQAAAGVGFEWPSVAACWAKVQEEIAELADGMARQDAANTVEELGDVLFALVNLARHVQIDPEQALAATNHKFIRRFQQMEQAAWAEGSRLAAEPLAQQLRRYQQAKANQSAGAGTGSNQQS